MSNATTGTLPIPFSAQTTFSQFVISSTADIDFGSLCVGSSLTKQITIENKGTFPFDYTIEGKPEPDDPTQKVDVKKKGKQSKTSTPVAVKRAKRSEKSILVSIIDTQLLFNGIIDFPFFSTAVKKAFQEYHGQVIETEDYHIIYYPDNFSSRQTSQRIKNPPFFWTCNMLNKANHGLII